MNDIPVQRLIDAHVLVDHRVLLTDSHTGNSCMAVKVSDIISAPTVDVVTDKINIVRCKDCLHFEPFVRGKNNFPYCDYMKDICTEDDFCSRGTKKKV